MEPLNDYLEKSTVLKAEDFIPSWSMPLRWMAKCTGFPRTSTPWPCSTTKTSLTNGCRVSLNDDTWDTLYEKLEKVASIDRHLRLGTAA